MGKDMIEEDEDDEIIDLENDNGNNDYDPDLIDSNPTGVYNSDEDDKDLGFDFSNYTSVFDAYTTKKDDKKEIKDVVPEIKEEIKKENTVETPVVNPEPLKKRRIQFDD